MAKKSQPFQLEGATRMPAATMGTRALRTSQLIQDKAREVFLVKGYYGTNIEDIADAAGVSRASFYTYFPTKRDVLLTIGQEAHDALDRALEVMLIEAAESGADAVESILGIYLDVLDEHGAFIEVWRQAAFDDEELRDAGLRAQLSSAKRWVAVLTACGWEPSDKPARIGLALQVMVERYWFQWKVAGMHDSRTDVIDTLSAIVRSTITGTGSQ